MKKLLLAAAFLCAAHYANALPPCTAGQLKQSDTSDQHCDVSTVTTTAREQYNRYRMANFAGVDADQFSVFLSALQGAVKSDDVNRIAALVQFPLHYTHGNRASARNAMQLERHYAEIFRPSIKAVVMNASLSNAMIVNSNGISLDGIGSVWIAGFSDSAKPGHVKFRIIRIN